MGKTKVSSPKPVPRLTPSLVGATADVIARESTDHAAAIDRLQRKGDVITALQVAQPVVVQGVQLPSGVETVVTHKLGRAPLAVVPGAVRGGLGGVGVITDLGTSYSGGMVDRSKFVVLQADAYGGTITVDVVFF